MCVCGSHLFLLTNEEEEEDRNCLPEPHYLWAEPIFFSSSSFLLVARHNRTPESGELRLSLSLLLTTKFPLFSFFFPEPHQHLESPISNIKGKEEKRGGPSLRGASCRFYFRFSSGESRSNPPA